jgi:hypothetical protein
MGLRITWGNCSRCRFYWNVCSSKQRTPSQQLPPPPPPPRPPPPPPPFHHGQMVQKIPAAFVYFIAQSSYTQQLCQVVHPPLLPPPRSLHSEGWSHLSSHLSIQDLLRAPTRVCRAPSLKICRERGSGGASAVSKGT